MINKYYNNINNSNSNNNTITITVMSGLMSVFDVALTLFFPSSVKMKP